MGDVLRIELSNGVYRRREPYTRHQINELSSLLPTQETTGPTVGTEMVFHERTPTSRAEIHRKVIRMVTPMSDLEAKLMLRQMGERV